MIKIDGSLGEGGSHTIRSSLALSLITGQPFHAVNVRAGRSRPGLLKQHLAAVRAAAEISGADVRSDELGSSELVFTPRAIGTGRCGFSVGTAGSATLVL